MTTLFSVVRWYFFTTVLLDLCCKHVAHFWVKSHIFKMLWVLIGSQCKCESGVSFHPVPVLLSKCGLFPKTHVVLWFMVQHSILLYLHLANVSSVCDGAWVNMGLFLYRVNVSLSILNASSSTVNSHRTRISAEWTGWVKFVTTCGINCF